MVKNLSKIVYVEWEDSCTDTGWGELAKGSTVLIKSTGFLVKKERSHIVITISVSSSGRLLDQLTIPRAVVKVLRVEKSLRRSK